MVWALETLRKTGGKPQDLLALFNAPKSASLKDMAAKAMEKNTGARGLRAILEIAMLEIMYDVPARKEVTEVTITKETILKAEPPQLTIKQVDRTGT